MEYQQKVGMQKLHEISIDSARPVSDMVVTPVVRFTVLVHYTILSLTLIPEDRLLHILWATPLQIRIVCQRLGVCVYKWMGDPRMKHTNWSPIVSFDSDNHEWSVVTPQSYLGKKKSVLIP